MLGSGHQLPAFPRCNGEWLRHWATAAPERTLYAERALQGWRRVTYAEALAAARTLGTALLRHGLGVDRPVAVLSDNSVDHALLALACQYAGVPIVPISPAYSLMSKDHAKLKAIFRLFVPGMVYVGEEAKFAATLADLGEFSSALIWYRVRQRSAPKISVPFWGHRWETMLLRQWTLRMPPSPPIPSPNSCSPPAPPARCASRRSPRSRPSHRSSSFEGACPALSPHFPAAVRKRMAGRGKAAGPQAALRR